MTTQKVIRRPFHEVIVEAIRTSTCDNVLCLMQIVRETQIESGHEDEIIEAMEQKWSRWPFWEKQVAEIKKDLLDQKKTDVVVFHHQKERRREKSSLLVLAR